MKKFFGKLPVMITFVALAVIFAAVYIGMLVRPVAIGMTYKGEVTMYGQTAEISVKVKSGKKLEMTTEVAGTTITNEGYYLEKDGYIVFLDAQNDEDYKAEKKEILDNWDECKAILDAGMSEMGGTDCNAFGVKVMGEDFKCTGSVVFAIVGGIVELILLAGAGLAVFYKVKK